MNAFSKTAAPTALMSAMNEELAAVLAQIQVEQVVPHAGRRFHLGRLHGQPVVACVSGIGKVAAAATTALLLERFGAARLVFTGVAGGLGAGVRVGDVVVARQCLQHDMDGSPIVPRYELPGLGISHLPTDAALTDRLAQAAQAAIADVLEHLRPEVAAAFGLLAAPTPASLAQPSVTEAPPLKPPAKNTPGGAARPQAHPATPPNTAHNTPEDAAALDTPRHAAAASTLREAATGFPPHPASASTPAPSLPLHRARLHQGLLISGDRFIATSAESRALQTALPDALAVEMEGAACAQVCRDFGVPFAVVRTISDRADDSAHVDFVPFLKQVASPYSACVIGRLLQMTPPQPARPAPAA